jgi:hypothetical protein
VWLYVNTVPFYIRLEHLQILACRVVMGEAEPTCWLLRDDY